MHPKYQVCSWNLEIRKGYPEGLFDVLDTKRPCPIIEWNCAFEMNNTNTSND